MSSTRPLRAAIVGAGLMGRWHAQAVTSAGGAVAIIVDSDRRRAEQLAARYPGSRVADDLDVASWAGDADVAHVCTPLATHAALAAGALHGGMHILVEKPMAETGPATADLLDLATSRGLMLCPFHQFLFQRGVLHAQQMLSKIGPLVHFDAIACSAGADGRSEQERDMIAADILPHPLSLMTRMLPTSLIDVDWRVAHPMAGEIRAVGCIGDVTTSINISMRGRPTCNELRLTGENGTVRVDLFHGFDVFDDGTVSRAHKIASPFLFAYRTAQAGATNLARRALHGEVAYPGLRSLVRSFYLAVSGSGELPISPEETLEVAAVRDTLLALMGRVHQPELAVAQAASRGALRVGRE